jgi:hypothetical protein
MHNKEISSEKATFLGWGEEQEKTIFKKVKEVKAGRFVERVRQ